jgi:hypothetical protein
MGRDCCIVPMTWADPTFTGSFGGMNPLIISTGGVSRLSDFRRMPK